MKILTGMKKSEFINNYCNHSKEKQFLLIDTIDNTYPFTADNLLILKSNMNTWLNDVIETDKELSKDTIFILFSNDIVDNSDYHKSRKQIQEKAKHYTEILNFIDRDFIIALNIKPANFKAYIEYVEV